MMNLVSIAERAVTIGIPTLAIDSSTGSRQIVGYSIWTGVIPWKLKWVRYIFEMFVFDQLSPDHIHRLLQSMITIS